MYFPDCRPPGRSRCAANHALRQSPSTACTSASAATAAVSARIGARASRVTFLPADNRYSRPVIAVDALAQFVTRSRRNGATAVHSIGEIELDGSDRDADWLRYEAATNDIFQDVAMHATCLYPRSLDERTLAGVFRTHPFIEDRGLTESPGYHGPHAACAHMVATRLAWASSSCSSR